jgi:ribonuclease E
LSAAQDMVATPAQSAPAALAEVKTQVTAAQAEPEAMVSAAVTSPAAIAPAATAAASVADTAPAAAAVQVMPVADSYKLPIDSLQQVAQRSGLVWVNSDADKVAAVQAAIAAEPQPLRVPRERPPVVVVNEGPLVLVETRKDLKTLQVPF